MSAFIDKGYEAYVVYGSMDFTKKMWPSTCVWFVYFGEPEQQTA
jgi:hypothetical protein